MVADEDKVFKALADASRRQLLDRLRRKNGQTLGELCEGHDMSRQAVTKHLHALADAGLVRCRSRGGARQRLWELRPSRLQEAQRFLSRISSEWDGALERLRAFVEK